MFCDIIDLLQGERNFEFAGEIIMTFGERLYELRKNKNISQEELAELLDVSRHGPVIIGLN